MVASHASANGVPAALVHRVIVRESRYQPRLVGRGGTIGLMQIKLATARGLGYTGDAEGLRDPDTNLTYGVKYLAGAYRAANGDHDRAVHYYAAGYYEVAKRQRLEAMKGSKIPAIQFPPPPPTRTRRILQAERSCPGRGAARLRGSANRHPRRPMDPDQQRTARCSASGERNIRCSSRPDALTRPRIGLH